MMENIISQRKRSFLYSTADSLTFFDFSTCLEGALCGYGSRLSQLVKKNIRLEKKTLILKPDAVFPFYKHQLSHFFRNCEYLQAHYDIVLTPRETAAPLFNDGDTRFDWEIALNNFNFNALDKVKTTINGEKNTNFQKLNLSHSSIVLQTSFSAKGLQSYLPAIKSLSAQQLPKALVCAPNHDFAYGNYLLLAIKKGNETATTKLHNCVFNALQDKHLIPFPELATYRQSISHCQKASLSRETQKHYRDAMQAIATLKKNFAKNKEISILPCPLPSFQPTAEISAAPTGTLIFAILLEGTANAVLNQKLLSQNNAYQQWYEGDSFNALPWAGIPASRLYYKVSKNTGFSFCTYRCNNHTRLLVGSLPYFNEQNHLPRRWKMLANALASLQPHH